MSFLFNIIQLFCWIAVGYQLALDNNWAAFGIGMFSIVIGLVSAMNDVGKELRKHGNSN